MKYDKFDVLITFGRWQIFHKEHERIFKEAFDRLRPGGKLIALVGSAGSARTARNPFTFEERKKMILSCFPDKVDQLIIEPLYDKMYNDAAWIKQVQDVVKAKTIEIANSGGFANHGTNDLRIGLIGAAKDNTSYYLKLFPQWESVDLTVTRDLHATALREGYFQGRFYRHEVVDNEISKPVADFLYNEFIYSDEYMNIRNEINHIKEYKKAWENAPYPVKHLTVDCVVEQSGHILLIRRRSAPGCGLFAVPGGHLEMDETLEDGAIRELMEETKIKVPEKVLRGNIVNRQMFDNPNRSSIGRVVTYAIHIKLPDDVKLPKVKGSDDADKAKWFPIAEIREDMMFDDHFFMINTFLGI